MDDELLKGEIHPRPKGTGFSFAERDKKMKEKPLKLLYYVWWDEYDQDGDGLETEDIKKAMHWIIHSPTINNDRGTLEITIDKVEGVFLDGNIRALQHLIMSCDKEKLKKELDKGSYFTDPKTMDVIRIDDECVYVLRELFELS